MSRSAGDRNLREEGLGRDGGFTLLEAVIAIALIGTAIVISSAFLNTLIVSADRLALQTGLLHEVESASEMMRAGLIPLETGILQTTGGAAPEGLVLTAIVEPRDVPGLYSVTLRAECPFRGQRISRTLVTAIWRP